MATQPLGAGRIGGGSKGEYLRWLGASPEAEYTLLMGATTYRLMSRLAAFGEPGTEPLAGMSKVVFSKTLREPPGLGEQRTRGPGRRRGGARDEG